MFSPLLRTPKRQQARLQDVTNLTPGVLSTSTAGQAGQTGTLFVRGLTTRYNQLYLDGVHVSDAVASSGTYGGLLGHLQLGSAK